MGYGNCKNLKRKCLPFFFFCSGIFAFDRELCDVLVECFSSMRLSDEYHCECYGIYFIACNRYDY